MTLSSSASRIASMNWPWNSAAMRRIRPSAWPTVRMTRGKSFGGITASATMPKTRSLPTSKSNMQRSRSGGRPAWRPATARRAGSVSRPCPSLWRRPGAGAVLEARRRGRRLGRLVVLGHAFLERFDALGDVAHDVGDLAFAAEQQQRDRREQHPVPNAQATHGVFPHERAVRPLGGRRLQIVPRNVSAPAGKHKRAGAGKPPAPRRLRLSRR